jgi:GTP-binding protein
MARKAIERSQVCLVVLDGGEGVTAQDTHVAGLVTEAGRGAVVVVNKSDLLPAGAAARREGAERIRERLKFLHDTPLVFVSALTGAGVSKVLAHALEVGAGYTRRVTTGELNRVLRAAWERHPPPGGKRPVRLYYATQTGSAPPRFTLFTSATSGLHFSYLRYLENAVRAAFPFEGVPVTFIMRWRGSRSR